MQLSVLGDMVVDGAPVPECVSNGARRGGVTPPPKVTARDGTTITVGLNGTSREGPNGERAAAALGTLRLTNNVVVEILTGATVRVRGDFQNESTSPQLFNWIDGKLVLDGLAAQVMEVAGGDVGPSLTGFGTPANLNFSIGTLRVEAGAAVTFANRFTNTVGAGACLLA